MGLPFFLSSGPRLPAQSVLYVDVANANCPGTGTRANPYCAIQTAIQAAKNSDTVLVMAGVYRENLDFLTKAIAVRSLSGPQATVIDAGLNGSGARFINQNQAVSTLAGFTIRNGSGSLPPGGSFLFGGGVYCYFSSPILEDLILENGTARYGGGVAGYVASPTLTRIVMRNNQATVNGGGACFMVRSQPVFTACLFSGNFAGHTGGGLNTRGPQSTPTLVNCLFDANQATDMSGAIRVGAQAGCNLIHCTFHRNSCPKYGGAVGAGSDTAGTAQTTYIRNCIFWKNQAPNGPELSLNGIHPAIVDIAFSDVRGGKNNVFVTSGFTLTWGAGMLDADPAFVDSASGDLHLTLPSPCRDKGSAKVSGLPATDFEGDPRSTGVVQDMGADEFHPHLYHNGTLSPGLPFVMRAIGNQNDFCVLLFGVRTARMPLVIPGIKGQLLVDPTFLLPLFLGTFPPAGHLSLVLGVPGSAPGGTVPTQALIGFEFSNLHPLTL